MALVGCRAQPPNTPRLLRDSKAEQAADSRLVFDQLTLARLGDPMRLCAEIRQLERSWTGCLLEHLRAALQFSEIIGMQDHGFDASGAVALDQVRVAELRLGHSHIIALD